MKTELNRWFAITNYRPCVFWSTLFFDGWTCMNVCTLSSCFELSVLKRALWSKWEGRNGIAVLWSAEAILIYSLSLFHLSICSLVHDNMVFTSLPLSLCVDNVPMSKEHRRHLLKLCYRLCGPRRELSGCWKVLFIVLVKYSSSFFVSCHRFMKKKKKKFVFCRLGRGILRVV